MSGPQLKLDDSQGSGGFSRWSPRRHYMASDHDLALITINANDEIKQQQHGHRNNLNHHSRLLTLRFWAVSNKRWINFGNFCRCGSRKGLYVGQRIKDYRSHGHLTKDREKLLVMWVSMTYLNYPTNKKSNIEMLDSCQHISI